MPYKAWRRQLSEIQVKIENYDGNLANYDEDLVEYWKNRKPLTDELEAHYAKEGDAIEESQKEGA